MPVVDEQARVRLQQRRGAKWPLVAISVPVVVLVTLLVVPMIRPVSFDVGGYHYWIACTPAAPSGALPWGPQGFSHLSDPPWGWDAWQLRLGNWCYEVNRVRWTDRSAGGG
jgi:hypothetical protein